MYKIGLTCPCRVLCTCPADPACHHLTAVSDLCVLLMHSTTVFTEGYFDDEPDDQGGVGHCAGAIDQHCLGPE